MIGRKRRSTAVLVAAAALLVLSPISSVGQVISQPIFGGGTAFEPEIDVVYSGALVDAQAVVSHDRRYVTLNMRPQNAELLNLFTFQFQSGGAVQLPNGFVGGVNPVVAGGNGTIPVLPNAPMRVSTGNGGAILLTRGLTPLVVGK